MSFPPNLSSFLKKIFSEYQLYVCSNFFRRSSILEKIAILGQPLCKFVFFCFFLVACLSGSKGVCEESREIATSGVKPLNSVADQESKKNAGVLLASFFRNYVSQVDGDRCPSLPSCSSYSVDVFKKHGFFIGWLMTVDRLIHESDEGSVSPNVYHNGRLRVLDPVENNDFWWAREDASTQR